jgi:hypothetical protein
MSADEKDQSGDKDQSSGEGNLELSDEGKEQVDQMQQAYNDDRPTAVLPGTDGTITGVAINEWLDDDGNPKFGKDKQQDDDAQPDDAPQQDDDAHQDDTD